MYCKYSLYCMCSTCEYNCGLCDDCHWAETAIHDVWTCTKYERSYELRRGTQEV